MPKKPKYDYNIDNIQKLQNKGMSIIQIANHYGWCKVSCQAWINRNYTKSIKYERK
jgi:transposase